MCVCVLDVYLDYSVCAYRWIEIRFHVSIDFNSIIKFVFFSYFIFEFVIGELRRKIAHEHEKLYALTFALFHQQMTSQFYHHFARLSRFNIHLNELQHFDRSNFFSFMENIENYRTIFLDAFAIFHASTKACQFRLEKSLFFFETNDESFGVIDAVSFWAIQLQLFSVLLMDFSSESHKTVTQPNLIIILIDPLINSD